MTKAGKCEVCRQRKVKCDEQRPTCEKCQRSQRICVYNRSHDDVFVHERLVAPECDGRPSTRVDPSSPASLTESGTTVSLSVRKRDATGSDIEVYLRLKRARDAQNGRGQFLTFKPVQRSRRGSSAIPGSEDYQGMLSAGQSATSSRSLSPLPPMPFSMQELLVQGLVADMGPSALEVAPFGDYVKSQWMSGENEMAVDYVLKSVKLFRNRTDANFGEASKAGRRALRNLRHRATIAANEDEKLALLHAVMMHYAAEQFVCLGSLYYVAHVNGVSQLVSSLPEQLREDAVIHSIVGTFCEDEVVEAMLAGRSTPMEVSIPPVMPDPGCYDVKVATAWTEYLLYQLPRLVCLVRSVLQTPESKEMASEAVSIAIRHYDSPADRYARQTVAAFSTTEPRTPQSVLPQGLEQVFRFTSPRSYTLALQYYLYRAILCGLLQTLHHQQTVEIPIGLAEIAAEDITAAKSLQMCADYAIGSPYSTPLVALKIIIPLEISFGCWHRLAKRQLSANTDHYRYAEQMKNWHVDIVQYVDRMWHTFPCNYYRLELLTDAMAGGALLWWMHDIRVPGFV